MPTLTLLLNVPLMKNKILLFVGFSLREKVLMMFLMMLFQVLNFGLIIYREKYSIITLLWNFLILSDLILQFKNAKKFKKN